MPSLDPIDRQRTALLAMDFQLDVAMPGGKTAPDDPEALARYTIVRERAALALAAARAAGLRVVHARVVVPPGAVGVNQHTQIGRFVLAHDALREGAPGTAFVPELAPLPGEPVVSKRMVSAFCGTDLDQVLRALGVDTLVCMGLVTHMVVEGTAREAADRGYRVITLSDACTSGSLARHEAALDILGRLGDLATVDQLACAIR